MISLGEVMACGLADIFILNVSHYNIMVIVMERSEIMQDKNEGLRNNTQSSNPIIAIASVS